MTGGLGGNGCAGGTCMNPDCEPLTTPADIGTYASLGFEAQPSYIPNDVIIPTFDDAPDATHSPPDATYGAGGWTASDLSFFESNGMHVDVFINTNNWCGDVTMNPECTATIKEILSLHNPANHTVYHPYMGQANTSAAGANPNGCDNVTDCTAELTGVETVIDSLSGGARPHLTRFRLPYGVPDQSGGANQAMVDGIVAQFAVGVGWNFDSQDSAGVSTGATIASNVEMSIGTAPGAGSWGVVLMHGTYPWTNAAIPMLFGPNGYLTQHNFKTATVEDAICWKYGMHSWDIVQQLSGQPRSPN